MNYCNLLMVCIMLITFQLTYVTMYLPFSQNWLTRVEYLSVGFPVHHSSELQLPILLVVPFVTHAIPFSMSPPLFVSQ